MGGASASARRRILIAGCGYVGCALGQRLARAGHDVWGLRRQTGLLPDGVNGICADLCDPESLKAVRGRFDAVYYTAGAPQFSNQAYRSTYVDGLRNLLDALDASGDEAWFLFTSSTGVYAQNDGGVVDETSPSEPASFSGMRILEGERLLRNRRPGAIVLRLGGIYGPRRTALIDRVRAGRARRDAEATRYLNLIHLADIVGALCHLMELDDPMPLYIGVDNEPQDYNALLEWIAAELGLPAPPFAAADEGRQRPVHHRRCSNARLRASGYTFVYPNARIGYRELMHAARPA